MTILKSSERVNGFALAKAAIHMSGLTTLEKLVLIILADHADSSAKSYPSIETITGLVGLNAKSGKQRQKIINIIKALEAKGLLSKAGYHGHSRQYRLNLTVSKQYTTGCTLNNTPRGVHEHTTEYNSNPTHTEALKASSPAVQAPTAEPTEPLAQGAQRSPIGSLADEPTALAPSATPTKPPFKYCRPTSNIYYCEDQQPGVAAAC